MRYRAARVKRDPKHALHLSLQVTVIVINDFCSVVTATNATWTTFKWLPTKWSIKELLKKSLTKPQALNRISNTSALQQMHGTKNTPLVRIGMARSALWEGRPALCFNSCVYCSRLAPHTLISPVTHLEPVMTWKYLTHTFAGEHNLPPSKSLAWLFYILYVI